MKITSRENDRRYLLVTMSLLILLTGCSHNREWDYTRVEHPGNYDVIKLGFTFVGESRARIIKAHDKTFYGYVDIAGPSYFSAYLLEHTRVNKGESVLDMGTGTGIQAIYAAENASHVLAADINQRALKNTILNAKRFGVEDKITVRESDLFNAINDDEKFDVIITSIPYAFSENTQNNWKLYERYFHDVGDHLNPDGRIYFISGFLSNLPRTKALIENNDLKIITMNMGYSISDGLEPIVYMIKHAHTTTTKDKKNR
ncbi:methyltransferase [Kaarinaea lacus]